MSLRPPTLDDVFLRLTDGQADNKADKAHKAHKELVT